MSTPLAQVADGATAAVVETVVPPVTETLPVLEPVLEPVSDLVTGSAPLPVPAPELPAVALEVELPAVIQAAPVDGAGEANVVQETAPLNAALTDIVEEPARADSSAGAGVLAKAFAAADTAAPSMSSDQPATTDPAAVPAVAPAVPGSGAGSGGSTGNSSGTAAWLGTYGFDLAFAGSDLAGEVSQHAPAPVSFDPGSSPD